MGYWTMSESGGPVRAHAVGFTRYPAYKDSGVEWLGEIPSHWEVRRADGLFRCEKIQIDPSLIDDDLVFHYSIPSIQETGDGALEPVDSIGSAKLQITGRRLLVSRLNPRKEVVLVATVRAPTTVCSTEFVPLKSRSSSVALEWAYYVLATESTRQRLSARVNSVTRSHQRVDTADVLKMWHAVPPPAEQQAIANFLDRETAKIDALVAKQQELIALLQEKRTALISRAVTKGLDPDAAMKDSGVEWLGWIPEHWGVQPLKTLSAMRSGDSITSVSIESTGPYPVFGGNGLRGYTGDFTHEGDHVLIGRQGAHCGNVHLARGRFWASEHAVVVTLKGPNLVEWFSALLEAMDLNRLSVAAAQPGLAVERLRDSHVPVAPVVEQREIVGFLDRETATIAELVSKANDAITLLNEYRTALISAAVTGRIDVRQQVADPPETTDYGPLSAKRTTQ